MRLRPSSVVVSLAASALGMAAALGAGTADAPEPIRVELKAHAGCPNENAFFSAVQARTSHVRRADAGEAARLFRITIEKAGDESVGTIVLGDAGSRTVKGGTCDEVVSALAFVAAVAVDPAVALGPPASASTTIVTSAAPSGVTSVAPSASVTDVMSAPSGSTSSTGSPPTAPTASTDVGAGAPPFPSEGPRVSAGVGVAAFGANAPGLVAYTPFYLQVHEALGGVLSPAGRLSIARGSGGTVPTGVGTASFRWTIAQLDVCPLRFPLLATLGVRPCLGIEGGSLSAEGETTTPRSDTRLWLAARLLVRVEWVVFDTVVVDAFGGIAAPFVRDRFVFDPSTPVYRAPAAYPMFGASLGVFFW